MGHSNTSLQNIESLTRAAITLRHTAGQRVFVATHGRGEYVLITRLFSEQEQQLERITTKRKQIRGQFVAELVECGKENQNYCTNVEYLHLLFKRPAKTLLEETNNRRALDEWFDEGELMMIAYCVLEGLKLLKEMANQYDIAVNQSSLFISNDGIIVLSDTDQYTDRLSAKHFNSHRLKDSKPKNREMFALSQLGLVLDHLQKGAKTRYSEGLREFIDRLIKGQVESYSLALQHLYSLKKSSKNAQQKDAMLSLMSLCHRPAKPTKPSQNNTTLITKAASSATQPARNPLSQPLAPNSMHNQDLRVIKRTRNNLEVQSPRSALEVHNARKQNGYLAYKSQFQAGVLETLAEENRVFEEGTTLRLDELSSIVQRGLSKQLEEQQQQSTFLLQELDKPDKHMPVLMQSGSAGAIALLQLPMIDLFSPSRPERLKQLVLNQKGIIYEESGDELQSLASQRTFRHKNHLQS